MFKNFLIIIGLLIIFQSCSKNELVYENKEAINPYNLYQEGIEAFNKNDYFFASKKFSEAEINFQNMDFAAKSALMSSYALYGINFYSQAIDNLDRYLKIYPADKNVMYAHYLSAIIYFEQISDEKKDLKPLMDARNKIDFFLNKYPGTDYALDLRFKKDLIQNQLAAKELFIAKHYISVKKWVPAINRLKIIIENFDKTVFVEEALHRLVEIHYHLGLEDEAKKYASILGYNYNSSRWFQQSYKILDKNYKIIDLAKEDKINKEDNFFKKIIKKIK
tara:strand:+ start:10889 stop:11719 length:831 start_codon:yes stop_codon:yes gene_type:complete